VITEECVRVIVVWLIRFMSCARCDSRSNRDQQKQQVREFIGSFQSLFESLLADLLIEQPADIKAYLIASLQAKANGLDKVNTSGVLGLGGITSPFDGHTGC